MDKFDIDYFLIESEIEHYNHDTYKVSNIADYLKIVEKLIKDGLNDNKDLFFRGQSDQIPHRSYAKRNRCLLRGKGDSHRSLFAAWPRWFIEPQNLEGNRGEIRRINRTTRGALRS